MLHYNFPPFSVGECGRIGTGRREIGHGKLAWRAINSSLPSAATLVIHSIFLGIEIINYPAQTYYLQLTRTA